MAKLRRADLSDVATLVAHRRKMWEEIGGYDAPELDDADPVYARWVRARMRSGRFLAWIVEERGEVAASGALWIMKVHPRPGHPSGDTPYLLSMWTEPAHRGRGHAKAIVLAAMEFSEKEGYPRMTLHGSVAGRPIYEKLGWVRTWEMKFESPTRQKAPSRSRREVRARSPGRS